MYATKRVRRELGDNLVMHGPPFWTFHYYVRIPSKWKQVIIPRLTCRENLAMRGSTILTLHCLRTKTIKNGNTLFQVNRQPAVSDSSAP